MRRRERPIKEMANAAAAVYCSNEPVRSGSREPFRGGVVSRAEKVPGPTARADTNRM